MTADQIVVRSPYDGAEVGRVPKCTAGDVDRAVAAAGAALEKGPLPPWRRAEILDAAARLLAEREDAFARTIALESAKPLKTARVEAQRAVSTFTFAAVEARRLTGEMVPIDATEIGEGRLAFTLRLPIGVVGAISPFNFPLNLVAHKLAPAIAAGCPVVLKPASQTPLTAVALADLLVNDAGLPADYLHVVTGSGADVGEALVRHPDVAYLTFTGSGEVGWAIKERAGRKKVALELGNNSPVIIEADGDWRAAAKAVAATGFAHAGQSCVSVQRVFVHQSVAGEFTHALVAHVEDLVVGDPLNESTDVSALISTDDRDRVVAWVEEAVAGGARLLTGGRVGDDGLLRPTVLADVTPDMRVCREEVFGPVVAVQAYQSTDEGLRLADDTRYGLQAGIYTSNLATALRAARELHFGAVLVNEVPTWRADQMPYGGVRASGNTKEGPAAAVREMTEERLVVIKA
jgi:acyl-CoA reductase-like NAD-dependent aldehyde dehydrogenase